MSDTLSLCVFIGELTTTTTTTRINLRSQISMQRYKKNKKDTER